MFQDVNVTKEDDKEFFDWWLVVNFICANDKKLINRSEIHLSY